MELLVVFILLLLIELVLIVWVLANLRVFRDRVRKMERNVTRLGAVVSDAADAQYAQDDTDISSLVSQATPEDIEQARNVLAALANLSATIED